ncbi:MAG: Asp-tRNA(Asn)/Glu-tRNA(Gln) amidotransferase subunit GatA [Coriobacteriia bacterium]|nr:Asp-tRNA(Asn)/Glu-tRNA(Gln) amidotransferase subunit GatA [Coriobacteriia bacterium]
MSALDLSSLSARQVRDGVAAGDFSARELADASYARIQALDADVHAFLQLTPALAYEAADRIDAARVAGEELPPLAGVPAGIKDNMNLIGTRTTCASRMLESYESVYDCTAVRRLLDAGALPIGKLNMDEFAFGSSTENSAFGPTRNPWSLDCVPGGSSGGSAASVAAGMVSISLGSDTGGSIRQPAALTGTVGLKPTYGRVSRYGVVAFGSSLDQIGPFGKTVDDAALALEAIAGEDPYDATSAAATVEPYAAVLDGDVRGLRVGLVTDILEVEGCAAEVRQSVLDAAKMFAALGADVAEVTLPSAKHGLAAYYVIGPAEASSNLARFDGIRYGHRVDDAADVIDLYSRSRTEGFGPETIRRIMLGTYALSAGYYDAYYGQAQKARTLIIQDFRKAFEQFDVLLTPTTPEPAFRFGEKSDPYTMYLNDFYTIPVNLAGNCAISVPSGLCSESGMPLGLQIIGDHFAETTVLRAAAAYEKALGFDTTPPLVRGRV